MGPVTDCVSKNKVGAEEMAHGVKVLKTSLKIGLYLRPNYKAPEVLMGT